MGSSRLPLVLSWMKSLDSKALSDVFVLMMDRCAFLCYRQDTIQGNELVNIKQKYVGNKHGIILIAICQSMDHLRRARKPGNYPS